MAEHAHKKKGQKGSKKDGSEQLTAYSSGQCLTQQIQTQIAQQPAYASQRIYLPGACPSFSFRVMWTYGAAGAGGFGGVTLWFFGATVVPLVALFCVGMK